MVGAEVGVGDEPGEDEDVGVADDPHRDHQRDPDRALAIDRDRLRRIEAAVPGALQQDQGEDGGQGAAQRGACDRPLEARSRDQQRHHRDQGQERARRLDGDVRIGASLEPDGDRGDAIDRTGPAGHRGPDDELRVGVVAEQPTGDRIGEDDREQRPEDRDEADQDEPGAERAARVGGELLVVVVIIIVVVAAERPLHRPLLRGQREQQGHQPGQEQQQPELAEGARVDEVRDEDRRDEGQRVGEHHPDGMDARVAQDLRAEGGPHAAGPAVLPPFSAQTDQLARSRPVNSRSRSASSCRTSRT